MKSFEEQMKKSAGPQGGIVQTICERLSSLISPKNGEIEVEDRYELESCKVLTYESVVAWLMKNKPANFDSALMVRYQDPKNKVFPCVVGLVFISGDNVLLGKDFLKKIIYCRTFDRDIEKLFGNNNSVILN